MMRIRKHSALRIPQEREQLTQKACTGNQLGQAKRHQEASVTQQEKNGPDQIRQDTVRQRPLKDYRWLRGLGLFLLFFKCN